MRRLIDSFSDGKTKEKSEGLKKALAFMQMFIKAIEVYQSSIAAFLERTDLKNSVSIFGFLS